MERQYSRPTTGAKSNAGGKAARRQVAPGGGPSGRNTKLAAAFSVVVVLVILGVWLTHQTLELDVNRVVESISETNQQQRDDTKKNDTPRRHRVPSVLKLLAEEGREQLGTGSCSGPFGGLAPSSQNAMRDVRAVGKAFLGRELGTLLDFGPRVGGTPDSIGYNKTRTFLEERLKCLSEGNGNQWWTAYEETFDTVETPLGRKRFVNFVAEFNGASLEAKQYIPPVTARAVHGKAATADGLKGRFHHSYPGHLVLAAHWDSKLIDQGSVVSEYLTPNEVAECVTRGFISQRLGEHLLEAAADKRHDALSHRLSDLEMLASDEGKTAEEIIALVGDGVKTTIGELNNRHTELRRLMKEDGVGSANLNECLSLRIPREKNFVGAIDSAAPLVVILEVMKFLSRVSDRALKQLRATTPKQGGASKGGDLSLPGFPKVTVLFFDGEEAFINWKGNDNTYGARLQAEKWEQDERQFYHQRQEDGHARKKETDARVPYNLLSGVTTFLLLDLLGHSQTTMHNLFPDHTGKQYGKLHRIEQAFSGGFAGEVAADTFWRRWGMSASGSKEGALAAESPLKVLVDGNMPESLGWAAISSAHSPFLQLVDGLQRAVKQAHRQQPKATPFIAPTDAAQTAVTFLTEALSQEKRRGSGGGTGGTPKFRPPLAREPYFPFEPSGIKSGVDDDHKHFLVRGVPILHLISVPFPPVWHELSDDQQHLNFDLIYEFTVLLAEYAITYEQDYYVANRADVKIGMGLSGYRSQQRSGAK